MEGYGRGLDPSFCFKARQIGATDPYLKRQFSSGSAQTCSSGLAIRGGYYKASGWWKGRFQLPASKP